MGDHMRSKPLLAAGMLALALVVAACSDTGPGAGTAGEPRTIEVTALDDLAYDPATIRVEAGETVRFVVTNAGEADHEFVVGDMEMQELAEEQMPEGMGEHAQAMASLEIAPGQTAETTVTFDAPGELFYACHVSGHYEGGMIGTITVG